MKAKRANKNKAMPVDVSSHKPLVEIESANYASLESFISADLPIGSAKEDLLNRSKFSVAMAKVIRNWRNKPSLAIGLYGDWGSGKSSVKNMIIESLTADGDGPITIVEFAPWQVSGQDLLAERFFKEIGNALARSGPSDDEGVKKRVARWKFYAAGLSLAATVTSKLKTAFAPSHPYLAPVADAASLALDSVSSAVKTGAEGIEAEGELERLSLAELKEEISRDLKLLDRPILVVLDDIDRLTKEEIRLTLQLVKANADFPNLIYLILAQKDVLTGALADIAPGHGDIFLEKIIQVGFDIPTVNRMQVQRLLLAGLNDVFSDPLLNKKFDAGYWNDVFRELLPLFRNLRDVNRFLGSLAFHVELFKSGTSFEVNPVDLIALEVIRVFENDLYKRLAREKPVLTYELRHFREKSKEDDKKRVEAILRATPDDRRGQIEKLLHLLFPPAASTRALFGANLDFAEQKWFSQLRVCSYQAFDRYFQFDTPEGDVSQAEIDEVLSKMSDQATLGSIFRELVNRGLLDAMLTRLNSLKETLPLKDAASFLAALYEVVPTHKLYSFFEPSPDRDIATITYWYLRRLPQDKRLRVMLDAISRTTGISFLAPTVSVLSGDPNEGGRTEPFLTSPQDRATLREACLTRIEEVTSKGYELQLHDFRMLRFWAAWRNAEARNWVADYLKKRDRLARFLRSAVHLSGEHPSAKEYISFESMEPIIPRAQLEARISELFTGKLNEEEQALVAMADEAMKRGSHIPGHEPFESEQEEAAF